MSEYPEEYRVSMNALLNLYERYLNLAFAVMNKTVVSSIVDDFYKQHGFETMLVRLWSEMEAVNKNASIATLPTIEQAFPVPVFSLLTDKSFNRIQHTFGEIKNLANNVGGTQNKMPEDVQIMINLASEVESGKKLETGILLSECEVKEYDTERAEILIADIPVSFRSMAKCDYLNKIMFQYPVRTPVSWDVVNENIALYGDEFRDLDTFFAAVYRINNHIKNRIKTKDNFYTRKDGMITREYGKDVVE